MAAPRGNNNNPNGNANLRPFTSESAAEAGRKSAAKRRANKLAREAGLMKGERADIARATRTVQEWMDTYERDNLGEVAAAVAQHLMVSVLNGTIEVDGRAVAGLIETATSIARLEAGLHTNATITATMSGADALERINAIRAQATHQVLSPPVVAVVEAHVTPHTSND